MFLSVSVSIIFVLSMQILLHINTSEKYSELFICSIISVSLLYKNTSKVREKNHATASPSVLLLTDYLTIYDNSVVKVV